MWLSNLSTEYASDLVQNSTEFLGILKQIPRGSITDSMVSFSIDVVSLYESLGQQLVFDALNDAMDLRRPDWTDQFRSWLTGVIGLSLGGAALSFKGSLYSPIKGIPTGSSLSVGLANICVFYVLKKILPNDERSRLVFFARFLDDTAAIFHGDEDSFILWFENLRNKSTTCFNLDLTYVVKKVNTFNQFLDIQFRFLDLGLGVLQTDLYKKPTDANRYLHFTSSHLDHVYKGIITSQVIRLRRLINVPMFLEMRLNDIKTFFANSGYPEN